MLLMQLTEFKSDRALLLSLPGAPAPESYVLARSRGRDLEHHFARFTAKELDTMRWAEIEAVVKRVSGVQK